MPLDKLLKAMFRYRLSRSEIAGLISAATVQYSQRLGLDGHRQLVHWPAIDRIRSISHIVSIQDWIDIWAYVLPSRLVHSVPSLVYCTANHGYSFLNMARRMTDCPGPCSVVIQDDCNNMLGVCLPAGLESGLETVLFSNIDKFYYCRASDLGRESGENTVLFRLDKSLSLIIGYDGDPGAMIQSRSYPVVGKSRSCISPRAWRAAPRTRSSMVLV